MSTTSNIFSNVYIYGNCTVKGTLTTLGGSAVSQWTTAGSIIYYTTGNVGIGTNNPTGSGSAGIVLHVADSTANNPTVHVDASIGTGQARLHLRSGTGSTNRASRIDFFNNVTSSTVPQWTIISGYDQNGTNDLRYVNYAGAITMAWAQNGNIGIGTTNPGSLLTVSGGVGIGSGYNAFTAPTGGLIVQGNVGIGTTNPGVNALQVTGNVVTQGFTSNATNTVFNFDTLTVPFVNATQIGIGNTTPPVNLWTQGTSTTTGIGVYNSDVALILGNTAGAQNAGSIQVRAGGSSSTIGATNYSLCLNPDGGNVGVGTVALSYKLHVNGGAIGVTGTNNYLYYAVTNSTASGAYMMFDAQTAGGSGRRYQIGSSGTGNNPGTGCFELYDATGNATRMVVNASGNVGIGKTNPVYRLDVNGYIRCNARDQGFLLGLDGAMWDNSRWWMDGGATYLDFGGMENGFRIRGNNDNSTSFPSQTYTEQLKITPRTGTGNPNGPGGVAFAAAGWAADRTWDNLPCISVFNVAGNGSTNQGEFRVHGAAMSYASYPDASGADFSVNFRIDGTVYGTSDRRAKSNISSITDALDIVMKLDGKRFQRINSSGKVQKHVSENSYKFGFVAQDLQAENIDELYIHYPGEDDGTDNFNNAFSVDYASLVAVLTNAIKQQQGQISSLEARLAALEAK